MQPDFAIDACPECGTAGSIELPSGRQIRLVTARLLPGPSLYVDCQMCGGGNIALGGGGMRRDGVYRPEPEVIEDTIRRAWPELDFTATVWVAPGDRQWLAVLLRAVGESQQ